MLNITQHSGHCQSIQNIAMIFRRFKHSVLFIAFKLTKHVLQQKPEQLKSTKIVDKRVFLQYLNKPSICISVCIPIGSFTSKLLNTAVAL